MESGDASIIDGLQREKDEEVGSGFKVRIFPTYSTNVFFIKKDGSRMILPHYYAVYESGEIELSDEYSEYKWISLSEVDSFEPKVINIPEILTKLKVLKYIDTTTDSMII